MLVFGSSLAKAERAEFIFNGLKMEVQYDPSLNRYDVQKVNVFEVPGTIRGVLPKVAFCELIKEKNSFLPLGQTKVTLNTDLAQIDLRVDESNRQVFEAGLKKALRLPEQHRFANAKTVMSFDSSLEDWGLELETGGTALMDQIKAPNGKTIAEIQKKLVGKAKLQRVSNQEFEVSLSSDLYCDLKSGQARLSIKRTYHLQTTEIEELDIREEEIHRVIERVAEIQNQKLPIRDLGDKLVLGVRTLEQVLGQENSQQIWGRDLFEEVARKMFLQERQNAVVPAPEVVHSLRAKSITSGSYQEQKNIPIKLNREIL
jgi:hypothetical protein